MAAPSFRSNLPAIALAAVTLLLISTTTNVSAQPPSVGSGCTPAITSLSPCLGFITGGNSTSAPSGQCCSQLASVVQTQTQCLCLFLNQTLPVGMPAINQTQAFTLPGACKIQTPPLSQCNAIAPAAAPAATPVSSPGPASSPATTPEASPSIPTAAPPSATLPPFAPAPAATPSDASGGSKTAGTNGQVSGASSTMLSSSMFVFLVVSSALVASLSGF